MKRLRAVVLAILDSEVAGTNAGGRGGGGHSVYQHKSLKLILIPGKIPQLLLTFEGYV
jgi:hypothetical protein